VMAKVPTSPMTLPVSTSPLASPSTRRRMSLRSAPTASLTLRGRRHTVASVPPRGPSCRGPARRRRATRRAVSAVRHQLRAAVSHPPVVWLPAESWKATTGATPVP
jgi:hypothetical protein